VSAGAAFLLVALLLDLVFHALDPAAVAATSRAFVLWHTATPHLAATGSLTDPLPTLASLPLVAFAGPFPALVTHNLAGSLVSVVVAAWAVAQLDRALVALGLARGPRLVLVALFALNPVVLLVAGSGGVGAWVLLALAGTTRHLVSWVGAGGRRPLVLAGTFLALGYLAAPAVVGAALAAGPLVALLAARRARPGPRGPAAATETVLFLLPLATTAAGWAVVSLVAGSPSLAPGLPSGASRSVRSGGALLPAQAHHLVHDLLDLAPLLVVLLAFAVVLAVGGRADRRLAAVLAVSGGTLVVAAAGFLAGPGRWAALDDVLAVVPLQVLLAGAVVVGLGPLPATRTRPRLTGYLRTTTAAVVFCLVAVGPSLFSTAAGLLDPAVGVTESAQIGLLFHRGPTPHDQAAAARWLAVGAGLRELHPGRGAVVAPADTPCLADVVATAPWGALLVPRDDQLAGVLADPAAHGAHYLLVPSSGGSLDARWPGLYSRGAGWAGLVRVFPASPECPALRLYRVTGRPTT
jgi:hypothetical protein